MSNWARILSALIVGASIVCAAWVYSTSQPRYYLAHSGRWYPMLLDRQTGKTWVFDPPNQEWKPVTPIDQ